MRFTKSKWFWFVFKKHMGYITQKVLKECGLVADPVPR